MKKRYFRNLKINASFYLSATILTAVTIFLFFTIFTAGYKVKNKIAEFYEVCNVEDAQITLAVSIEDEKELEDKYNITLEKNRYVNCEDGNKTLRMYAASEIINVSELLEGEGIENSDEILLSPSFCEKNKINIGDFYVLKGRKYKVTGYGVRPDYLYSLKEFTDSYPDFENFGVGIIMSSELELLGEVEEYYSVCYGEDTDVDAFLKEIRESNGIINYLDATNNQRIRYARTSPESYIMMSVMVLPIMLLLVVFMISIVLGRKIKQERKIIGALYALGYKKEQLKRFYIGYACIPGIFGGGLGIVLSIIFLNSIAKFVSKNFEDIFGSITVIVPLVLLCMLGPAVLYSVIAYISAGKMLKIKPVVLLSGRENEKSKKSKIFSNNKKIKFVTRFQIRLLANNKFRTFVVLLGIILSCFAMELGFICNNSTESFIKTSIDKVGTYENIYYLKTFYEEVALKEQDGFVYGSFKPDDSDSKFSLIGGKPDERYLSLVNMNGEKIDLSQGYYITHIAAILYGVDAGDTFTICNYTTMEKHEVTITGIIDDDVQKNLYTSVENARDILGIEGELYNMIVSDVELELPDSDVAVISSKETLKNQLNSVLESTKKMIQMMIVIGVIVCVFVVYMTVNMIIDENRSNISMLKVLGYRKNEINRMVLNVNNCLIPLGIILSVPISVIVCEVFFEAMIENFACYIKASIGFDSILICATILILSYMVALQILKHKVYQVSMVESLKDNR